MVWPGSLTGPGIMSSDETVNATIMGETGSPVLKTKVRGRERNGIGQIKAPR